MRKSIISVTIAVFLLGMTCAIAGGNKPLEEYKTSSLKKVNTIFTEARTFLMNGNQILGVIYDYGGIGPGLNMVEPRHIDNMVWHGLGDIYQFGPIVGAEVVDTNSVIQHIFSDAIYDGYAYDRNPLNTNIIWGWAPIVQGYVDPTSKKMASSGAADANGDGKPDSWPKEWYNPSKGQYVWPGYLKQDVPNADLEVLWGMDDRNNSEYLYFPFYPDSVRRGLGVKVEGRALQWSTAQGQNCIFFIYTAQNYSPKDLNDVYFGMYGDVDVGGGSTPAGENKDDYGLFVSPLDSVTHDADRRPVPLASRSIVYLWDKNGKGYLGRTTHYDACKFLESPSNSIDGKDNDGDGMIDESQTNNIDDDHDWKPSTDDLGLDGVPETQDHGEGDGFPTKGERLADGTLNPLKPGEPNFELTDLDESDQIGLTAFKAYAWTTRQLNDDPVTWQTLDSGFTDTFIPNETDIIFMYGSGKINLKRAGMDGSVKRFSIALLMGWNLADLLITAQTVQLIYNQNYQFIRPPDKPTLTAVPGDKKVTLYWDDRAEKSVDPILGPDFEGYVVYRSTDPQFSDQNTITDGSGTPFLYKPLTTLNGKEARWDIAKRPEPVEDSTFLMGFSNAIPLPGVKGKMFLDVNNNGVADTAILVDDWWKGYAPVEYDQRGLSYYLGDNSGLVHSFVDTNNVINGQTYYYAVVSFDHGYYKNYPASECTKRISLDPITSQFTYDVNTASVIPGPRTSGYDMAGIVDRSGKRSNLERLSGTGTGVIDVQIIDDLAIPDNITYRLEFSDSMMVGSTKKAALNYSVVRQTPMYSEVVLFDTSFVKIGTLNITNDTVFQVRNSLTNVLYSEGKDYVVDRTRGFIRRTGYGAMTDKGPYRIKYRYYGLMNSTKINNEEANLAFDGMKLFIQNHTTAVDTIKSSWVINKKRFFVKVQKPSSGTQKPAPIDVQVIFNNTSKDTSGKYVFPGDTVLNSKTGKKTVVTPFKFVNITADTTRRKIPLVVIADEGNTTSPTFNSRWDIGEPLLIQTPQPWRTSGVAVYMCEVKIGVDTINNKDTLNFAGGDVYQVITQQPFAGANSATYGQTKDIYEYTTVAGKFDAKKASLALDEIKVVPNPYVAVNDIEPNDRLAGATRGSRRIYFEHLPARATIRIYTLSGELVRTLEHDAGISNGREYWDLLNRDNLGVAYGVYLAHVDAPGVGEKILKFAIIK